MQNDEYYAAYIREWNKMLKTELTDDERAQLKAELKQIELNRSSSNGNEVSSNVY